MDRIINVRNVLFRESQFVSAGSDSSGFSPERYFVNVSLANEKNITIAAMDGADADAILAELKKALSPI